MNQSVKFITRTAILLALTVLFQSLRVLMPFMPANISQYVIGSLVNLCLIVAAVMVGIKGGLIIAIAAPIIAFLQGFTPSPVLIVPIALGNVVLVAVVYFLYARNSIIAFALGAVLKFITLYISVVKIALPLFLPKAPEKMQALLSVQFSWPQLITASIGGILALGVLAVLNKVIRN
jgi:hypothetical protein